MTDNNDFFERNKESIVIIRKIITDQFKGNIENELKVEVADKLDDNLDLNFTVNSAGNTYHIYIAWTFIDDFKGMARHPDHFRNWQLASKVKTTRCVHIDKMGACSPCDYRPNFK